MQIGALRSWITAEMHTLQGKLSKKWLDYTAKQDSKREKYRCLGS